MVLPVSSEIFVSAVEAFQGAERSMTLHKPNPWFPQRRTFCKGHRFLIDRFWCETVKDERATDRTQVWHLTLCSEEWMIMCDFSFGQRYPAGGSNEVEVPAHRLIGVARSDLVGSNRFLSDFEFRGDPEQAQRDIMEIILRA